MKKLVIVVFGLVLLFGSCKKDNDPTYYIKFKKDGTWITWKSAIGELGPDLANPAKTDFGISSTDDSQNAVFDLTIQIDGNNFNTGTYDSDSQQYWVVVAYFTTNPLAAYMIEDAPSMSPSRYVINVTSITSTTLSGTFTGNYLYDSSEDKLVTITEGEFHVQRAR